MKRPQNVLILIVWINEHGEKKMLKTNEMESQILL